MGLDEIEGRDDLIFIDASNSAFGRFFDARNASNCNDEISMSSTLKMRTACDVPTLGHVERP